MMENDTIVVIPKNATNLEAISALYPELTKYNDTVYFFDNNMENVSHVMATQEWLNAPYKKGEK